MYGGQITTFKFDFLTSTIQLEIHVLDEAKETNFSLTFLRVSELEYIREPLEWNYVDLTSIEATEVSYSETTLWSIEMELWSEKNRLNILCAEWRLTELNTNSLTSRTVDT